MLNIVRVFLNRNMSGEQPMQAASHMYRNNALRTHATPAGVEQVLSIAFFYKHLNPLDSGKAAIERFYRVMS